MAAAETIPRCDRPANAIMIQTPLIVSAISRIALNVPTSLFECMMLTSRVRGVIALRTSSGSTIPKRSTGTTVPAMNTVDTGSTREEVSVALVDARVGGRVLVHAGEAIAVVEESPQ